MKRLLVALLLVLAIVPSLVSAALVEDFTGYNGAVAGLAHQDANDNGGGSEWLSTGTYDITYISADIKANGAPTVNYVAQIWSESGSFPNTLLGTSDNFDPSVVSTGSYGLYNFTFSTPVSITTGNRYFLTYKRVDNGFDASNYILTDGATPVAGYDLVRNGGSGWGLWGADWHISFQVWDTPFPTNSNATLTAENTYTSASLTNFSVVWNGSTYSTTNGTVVLPVLTNTTSLWNLTYNSTEAGGYFERSYNDINLSTTHIGSLHQAEITFNASNRVSGAAVTSFTANTSSNGGSTSDTATNPQLNVTAADNYTAEFNKNGYYAAFTTFNASALSTSNATFSVYDHKLNITINILGGSATDQNFTVDVYGKDSLAGYYEQASTTNGYIEFNLTDGNYTVWLNDSIHELTSANLTLNTSVNLTAYQFDVYTTNAVTFRFYTEEDPELLDFRNVTAFLTGDIVSYNFTTDNGTYYIDLIEPQPYVVTFFADDFAQRQWHFTLTNRTSEQIDLFLINDSDDSIIEANVVQTLLDTVVNNATVRLARKNLSGTNYYNVESCVTAVDGSCLLHAQIQDPTYRLTVLYEGTTRLISEDFQFSSTAASNGITIPIQLSSSTLQTWRELGDVSYTYTNTTPTNDTVQFTFSWSDNEGNVQSGCLKVTQRTLSSWSTAYSSCTSGTTGTETYTLNTTNIDEYDSLAYFTYAGGQYDVTASGENVDDPLSRGGGAVLFSIALVLLVTVIAYGLSQGSAAGLITPVLVGASLLLMYWFGIFTITRGAIVTLVLLAAVVVWITARRNA